MEDTQRQLLEELLKRDSEEAIDYIDNASRFSFNAGAITGILTIGSIFGLAWLSNKISNKVENRVANYVTYKEGK